MGQTSRNGHGEPWGLGRDEPAADGALFEVVTSSVLAHARTCLTTGRLDAAIGAFGVAIVLTRTTRHPKR